MKTTTVYRGPGYPVDPKKEEQRARKGDPDYECIMLPPRPNPTLALAVDKLTKMGITIASLAIRLNERKLLKP